MAATSIRLCESQDNSQKAPETGKETATCPDIYDFLEAFHESSLAISQEFRDFRLDNIVDAMDCHGNWIAATIEGVHGTHPKGVGLMRPLPNFVAALPENITTNAIQQSQIDRSIAHQSSRFCRGRANLVKRKLVKRYEHEIDPRAYFDDMDSLVNDQQQEAMLCSLTHTPVILYLLTSTLV